MFCGTVNETVPAPVPWLPLVIVIHDALLLAVHAQPFVVETLMKPLAFELVNVCVAELTEYEQLATEKLTALEALPVCGSKTVTGN